MLHLPQVLNATPVPVGYRIEAIAPSLSQPYVAFAKFQLAQQQQGVPALSILLVGIVFAPVVYTPFRI